MDREGQRTVFVGYRSYRSKVSDMKGPLCEEEDQAWTGVGTRLHRGGLFRGIYFAAGLKGCCNAALVTQGSVETAGFVNGPPM